jgi:uncharacterized membrane protein YvbJ
MKTQEWINEVLKSTDGMVKISPDDSLFFKIQSRIIDTKISSRWIWLAAASFVILVSLNVKFVFGKANSKENQTEILASTIAKSNQLY